MGGKTSAKSKNAWAAKVYDRINLTVPKGRKEEIQAYVERHGQSVNGFINSLIDEALERERPSDAPGSAGVPSTGGAPQMPERETDAPGTVSIISSGGDAPQAASCPTCHTAPPSTPAPEQLSPDEWAVWAHRHEGESVQDWRRRLKQSERGASGLDIMKRLARLSRPEQDLLLGLDPESMKQRREQREQEAQEEQKDEWPEWLSGTRHKDLPF